MTQMSALMDFSGPQDWGNIHYILILGKRIRNPSHKHVVFTVGTYFYLQVHKTNIRCLISCT